MTKTARDIVERAVAAGVGINTSFDTQTTFNEKFGNAVDQALKELEAIIEATYDNLPSLDKLTVGNEMSDGYDQGVEAFRQATIKALYGKESK